jgi:hypothetical protein
MGGWGIVIGSRNGVLLLQSCEWTGAWLMAKAVQAVLVCVCVWN